MVLKGEIRVAIVLHKPRTVDDVLSLAVLRQEELEAVVRKPYHINGSKDFDNFIDRPTNHQGKGILGAARVENKYQNKPK